MKSNIFSARVLINAALFVSLIALTFFILLRGQNISDLTTVLHSVKVRYLLLAAGCMCIFLSCEAINIRRCLQLFGYRCGLPQAVKYALTGFFFSSVTPSASGGQPMQLYAMHRDHVPVSHGTLALLIQFCAFQTVTVTFAITGFASQHAFLSQEIGGFLYFFLLGVSINILLLVLTLTAILSRRLSGFLLHAVCGILRIFHIKRAAEIMCNLTEQLTLYQHSAACLRQNMPVMCRVLTVTTVQIVAFYSIPYWVYLSLGLPQCSFWMIACIQAVLHVAVSALPLPGAVGASEGAFLLLFQAVFPAAALHDAMLLSRGVSFYLFVAFSGIVTAFSIFGQKKNSETI